MIGWLFVSKFVGSHNRCWCFDIHIFDDKDKERISHLNIHHTVKTAVVLNIKATFSSSWVILFVSGLVLVILTLCLSSMLGLTSCLQLCSLLDLMSGSFFA